MGRESVEASLSMEMRRGTIVLCVLCLLDKPAYGYNLVTELEKRGLSVEGNTLYPLLRRLSSQGLLESVWDTSSSKPRKYYRITEAGLCVRDNMKKEWQFLAEAVSQFLPR